MLCVSNPDDFCIQLCHLRTQVSFNTVVCHDFGPYVQPKKQAGTKRCRLNCVNSWPGPKRVKIRVTSIKGCSSSEAIDFQTWPAGTERGAHLFVPARLLGCTYGPQYLILKLSDTALLCKQRRAVGMCSSWIRWAFAKYHHADS